jgi:hypothetical protein
MKIGSSTSSRNIKIVSSRCGCSIPDYVKGMKQSDIYRENAENCLQLAERAEGKPAFRRYLRMANAWTALAHEQDWLDGEIPPCAAQSEVLT